MRYGYQLAYKIACEQLENVDSIEEQCLKSGARCTVVDSQRVITVDYLNRPHRVTLPDVDVRLEGSEEEVPLREKVLILHYLIQAKGTLPSNKLIAYKELPGGLSYLPVFSKRTIGPLVRHFGNEPERLLEVAKLVGGRSAEYGDVAVTIDAFSRVPITFVLWRGDDEFPPDGNIVFDSTVSDYLTTDDVNAVTEMIAWKLVRLLGG